MLASENIHKQNTALTYFFKHLPPTYLGTCSQIHNTRHAPQNGLNTHRHPLKHAPITNPKTALDIEEIEAGAQKYLK